MKKLIIIQVVFFFFACTCCSFAQQTIKVGGFENYPVIYKNEMGKVDGIYPDLLAEIARENNLKIEYVLGPFQQCLEKLGKGEIDLMSSITPTEERKQLFNFSRENVLMMWGQVFLPIDSTIQTILDLQDKKVGVLLGGINGKNFMELRDKFQVKCEIISYPAYSEIIENIQSGKLDAGILNNVNGEALTQQYAIKPSAIVFTPFPLVFAAPKGAGKQLLDVIDKKLIVWKVQKDSFFYQTLKKWYGDMKIEPKDDLSWVYIAFGLIFLVIIMMFFTMKVLQFQVQKRTTELNKANEDLKREIDERKLIEKTVLSQKEQYRAVTEATSDYVMRYDRNCRQIFANQRAILATGLSPEEYIGKNHRELGFPENLCQLWEKNIESVFITGKSRKIEFDVALSTGSTTLELNLNPEFDDHGEIISVIGVSRDISQRKKSEREKLELEKRLQHSHRLEAIGTLAGGIAHDINNILTPILGYSELISGPLQPDNPEFEAIKEIHKAALRGKELARQILFFSRQPEPNVRAIRLQDLIDEVLKLSRSTLPTTISIERNITEECSKIAGDPAQIHQVLMNLITNAFYAMKDSGGVLKISLNEILIDNDENPYAIPPGIYACLVISDTGVGMEPDVLERIFEPYFTTKPKEKGSGLGLSVVHGIVSKNGGKIFVESSPGIGTKFKIFFPLASAIVFEMEEVKEDEIVGGDETILVVDDEEMIVKLENRLLSGLGYKVVGFTSSNEALKYFKANSSTVDLVLTDMTMPGLTGDILASEAIQSKPSISIIICTGFSESISPERAKAIGVKALLIKPVTLRDLAEKIREALDN